MAAKSCLFLALASVAVAKVCDRREFAKPYETDRRYFLKCEPLEDNFRNEAIGLWHRHACPNHTVFIHVRQSCVSKRQVDSEEALCADRPDSHLCRKRGECQITPINEKDCDWTREPFRSDPKSRRHFFQCVPKAFGDSCGKWYHHECVSAAVFIPNLQACVVMGAPTACNASEISIGQQCLNGTRLCPAAAVCRAGVTCCHPLPELQSTYDNQRRRRWPESDGILPICPSTGKTAASTCGNGCSGGYSCYLGGCCPLSSCDNGILGTTFCNPDDRSCNPGYVCREHTCCPVGSTGSSSRDLDPMSDVVTTPAELCPNGERLAGICAAGCKDGYACFNNMGCCRLHSCPDSAEPTAFCDDSCRGFCHMGSCCERNEVRPALSGSEVPTIAPAVPQSATVPCPSGARPLGNCYDKDFKCEGVCFLGICCPMERCPDNQRPLGWCSTSRGPLSTCSSGFCHKGTCCPRPPHPMLPESPPAEPPRTSPTALRPESRSFPAKTNEPRVVPDSVTGGTPNTFFGAEGNRRFGSTVTDNWVQQYIRTTPPKSHSNEPRVQEKDTSSAPQCPADLHMVTQCSKRFPATHPHACPTSSVCIEGVCCSGQPSSPLTTVRTNLPRSSLPTSEPSTGSTAETRGGDRPSGAYPRTNRPAAGTTDAGRTHRGNHLVPPTVPDLPICPSGAVAIQPAVGTWCPSGFTNINGGCCAAPRVPPRAQPPLPTAYLPQAAGQRQFFTRLQPSANKSPVGATASDQHEDNNSACDSGYTVVGRCDRGSACPPGAGCTRGLCCAVHRSTNFASPVARCHPGSCPHGAACVNGECQCLPGFAFNGYSCVFSPGGLMTHGGTHSEILARV